MIKRSFVVAGLAAVALMSVAPAASAAEVYIGPWAVQVPDVAPVVVPIPMGSEAGALPPLPFPLVWDLPFIPAPVAAPAPRQAPAATYVANCTEARRLGIAPIYRGQDAYRPALDRDNDGVACE